MTGARNTAWQLPLPARVSALLAGSTAEEVERFWKWFEPLYRASPGCDVNADALAAWARVINSDLVLAWWQSDIGKVALPRAMLLRGLAGVARIVEAEAGWYTLTDSGQGGSQAVITWLAGEPGIGAGLDLLAMAPHNPRRYWCMTGAAEILPGRRQQEEIGRGQIIRLFEYPLAWMAADAAQGSFCVLRWESRAGQELLLDLDAGFFTVVCDSDDHARRLRALARPRRKPLRLRVAAGA